LHYHINFHRLLAGCSQRGDTARDSRRSSAESVKGRHMARALLGHLPNAADRYLVEEVARLRSRVRDLEAELAEVRASHEASQLLDELHRLTTDASALA
jgi:hypothetical protein